MSGAEGNGNPTETTYRRFSPAIVSRRVCRSSRTSRLRSAASCVLWPCRKFPFFVPRGAPGLLPPCNLHRPLAIAGQRHGLPVVLAWAPQRGCASSAR